MPKKEYTAKQLNEIASHHFHHKEFQKFKRAKTVAKKLLILAPILKRYHYKPERKASVPFDGSNENLIKLAFTNYKVSKLKKYTLKLQKEWKEMSKKEKFKYLDSKHRISEDEYYYSIRQ